MARRLKSPHLGLICQRMKTLISPLHSSSVSKSINDIVPLLVMGVKRERVSSDQRVHGILICWTFVDELFASTAVVVGAFSVEFFLLQIMLSCSMTVPFIHKLAHVELLDGSFVYPQISRCKKCCWGRLPLIPSHLASPQSNLCWVGKLLNFRN